MFVHASRLQEVHERYADICVRNPLLVGSVCWLLTAAVCRYCHTISAQAWFRHSRPIQKGHDSLYKEWQGQCN